LATLQWDKVGERSFETGVDRGVLYLRDGRVIPWNGLRSVEESTDSESQAFYLDGVKYLHRVSPGDYAGRLVALTYPDEFDELQGVDHVAEGMSYYNQGFKPFHLSYRTRAGNDVEGIDHGYKLHILYNVLAVPDTRSFSTLADQLTPVEFAWSLNATPPAVSGHRPTAHISIDSRNSNPDVLSTIEEILYGSDFTNPRIPSLDEITELMSMFGALVIVDNGDGTWTAIDLADQFITMDSPTQFTINNVDATYSDPDTYQVSTTNP